MHRISGLPGESGPVGLTLGLGRLRALGATGLRLALPVAGHPLGLTGRRSSTPARSRPARRWSTVGAVALGLVPEVYEAGPAGDLHVDVEWQCLPVRDAPPADVPSLGEAERELAEALRDATDALARLDVAGAGPAAQAALEAYRARAERGREVLAPGYPPRAVRVLELAQRVAALVRIAADGDGGGGERVADRRAGGSAAAGGADRPPGAGGGVQRLCGGGGAAQAVRAVRRPAGRPEYAPGPAATWVRRPRGPRGAPCVRSGGRVSRCGWRHRLTAVVAERRVEQADHVDGVAGDVDRTCTGTWTRLPETDARAT